MVYDDVISCFSVQSPERSTVSFTSQKQASCTNMIPECVLCSIPGGMTTTWLLGRADPTIALSCIYMYMIISEHSAAGIYVHAFMCVYLSTRRAHYTNLTSFVHPEMLC